MHEASVINPLEIENWNNLLASTPGCSFFHTADWSDVLIKSYRYTPLYLYTRGKDSFISLLPLMEVNSPLTGKRGVCLPFTDTCEPVSENGQCFRRLFDEAIALGRKRQWKYLEIRGGEKYLSLEKPSEVFTGHILDLGCGQQKLYSNLRDSTRRNIKKAQNGKVEVHISHELKAVKEFYRLNTLTRKTHGLPPQPYKFFQHLFDRVISRNMGFIAFATFDGQVVAANVYLHFGKEVIYKYGASDKAHQHLRASNLVMWEAVRWSCENNFQTLSFGRTEQENEGLMQFKAGWGVNPHTIYYYRYDLQKNVFISDSSGINPLFNKVFSKLPVPVLEILGRILYRHMG
jgi:hypothetical protein